MRSRTLSPPGNGRRPLPEAGRRLPEAHGAGDDPGDAVYRGHGLLHRGRIPPPIPGQDEPDPSDLQTVGRQHRRPGWGEARTAAAGDRRRRRPDRRARGGLPAGPFPEDGPAVVRFRPVGRRPSVWV